MKTFKLILPELGQDFFPAIIFSLSEAWNFVKNAKLMIVKPKIIKTVVRYRQFYCCPVRSFWARFQLGRHSFSSQWLQKLRR